MDTKKLAQELLAWFDERDIHDISAQENVGEQKNLTAFFFPVEEEGGYPSYEIIATIAEDVHPFFYVDYCDIPEDADADALFRYINELNTVSLFTVTAEDGRLCFSYYLPPEIVREGGDIARTFFDLWDAVDAIKDRIADAFGFRTEEAEYEENEENEENEDEPDAEDAEDDEATDEE